MADYITLMGAEDVRRAAHTIAEAADTMNRASGNLDEVLHRQRLFMDDWLNRLEAVLQESAKDNP